MPYAQNGDVSIYYESHGEGPAIVFVHGGNGNTLSWFNQVPFFATRFRCVTVDLRGFKHSTIPIELYHPRHYVPDMLAVLDHAGIARASFVCQSLGAWAGMPMAVKHPDRVDCLVINGSPTPVNSPENQIVLQKSMATSLAVQRGDLPNARSTGMSERFMIEQRELTFLYEAIGRLNGPRRTKTMLDEDVMIQLRDFAGYRAPTLIMGGRHDHFLTPEHHLHIASLVPGAKSHTFENAGHSAYFEEPQEFNRVVAAFLDSHAAS